jgi:hypothetical protein
MPAAHPEEFRRRAVELARLREKPIAQIAKDIGISESLPAPLDGSTPTFAPAAPWRRRRSHAAAACAHRTSTAGSGSLGPVSIRRAVERPIPVVATTSSKTLPRLPWMHRRIESAAY